MQLLVSYNFGLQQTLRSFEQEISDLKREEEIEARGKKLKHYRGDSNVPYPRISGARFCGRGQLVCFGQRYQIFTDKEVGIKEAAIKTPRAL